MKNSVYIFDVDGVLNNLTSSESDPRIIAHIATLLDAGTYVAVNTGRGYEWVEDNVIQPLKKELETADSLNRFFVAVEMGGLAVEFEGCAENRIKSAFSLSKEQIALVRSTFETYPKYTDTLYWYGKESMATLVKNNTTSMEVFRPIQKALTTILQVAFNQQNVVVANSNDAIDIHSIQAGKWAGAELIYEWLRRSTNVDHDHFVCLGDSPVDYEMARFFAEQSHDTVFVFTGSELGATGSYANLEVVKTELPYNEGAYQYLQDFGLPLSEKQS